MRPIFYFCLLMTISFVLAYEARTFVFPPSSQEPSSKILFIKPGSKIPTISYELESNGVIEDGWKFRFLSRILRLERKLKPGEYKFETPSSPYRALRVLAEGKVILRKVTLPEGITMKEVGQLLDQQSLVPIDHFSSLATQRAFLDEMGIPGTTLEGFLFPNTYLFSRVDEPTKMIRTMVDQFRKSIRAEDKEKAVRLSFSLLQWITLASIIEKESSSPSEHRIISSVFHNRLKKKMRLQSDPTVIYGISNYNGNITKKDLLTPTPYNTYTIYGLPPGPIANPSASAIHAAVDPETTDFLYFVANGNGRHVFAKTYAEHEKNVVNYQLHHSTTAAEHP